MTSAGSYHFRLRFALSGRTPLPFTGEVAVLHKDPQTEVSLQSLNRAEDLSTATDLVLLGGPYESNEEAAQAGEEWRDRLTQAFACVGLGADFGDRRPTGGMVDSELAKMAEVADWPVRNETYGVQTFQGDKVPVFMSVSGDLTVGIPEDRLRLALESAGQRDRITDRERLAYDLYSLSRTVADRPDARFVVLMMAFEALVETQERPSEVCRHIDALVDMTQEAGDLHPQDREVLSNALLPLKRESARRAGSRLIASLAGRTYAGLAPERLYRQCYDLRNALVHGRSTRPPRDQVARLGAALEQVVGHLIGGRSLVDDVLG